MGEVLPLIPEEHRRIEELVRRLWREGEVVFTQHAIERMNERRVDAEDIRHALLHGRIAEHQPQPPDGRRCRYAFKGSSVDGVRLRPVVEIDDERLIIVTVMQP